MTDKTFHFFDRAKYEPHDEHVVRFTHCIREARDARDAIGNKRVHEVPYYWEMEQTSFTRDLMKKLDQLSCPHVTETLWYNSE